MLVLLFSFVSGSGLAFVYCISSAGWGIGSFASITAVISSSRPNAIITTPAFEAVSCDVCWKESRVQWLAHCSWVQPVPAVHPVNDLFITSHFILIYIYICQLLQYLQIKWVNGSYCFWYPVRFSCHNSVCMRLESVGNLKVWSNQVDFMAFSFWFLLYEMQAKVWTKLSPFRSDSVTNSMVFSVRPYGSQGTYVKLWMALRIPQHFAECDHGMLWNWGEASIMFGKYLCFLNRAYL